MAIGDLTTTAKVKNFLKITSTGDDTHIGTLITSMSDYIRTITDRDLYSKSYTEYYDGSGKNTLQLDNYPITVLTSIYDDTDYEFGADTEITSDDYFFNADTKYSKRGVLLLNGCNFTEGQQNIKVTYTAGYETIPTDLDQACVRLTAAEYLEGAEGAQIAVETEQDRPSRYRDEGMEMVKKYKRMI